MLVIGFQLDINSQAHTLMETKKLLSPAELAWNYSNAIIIIEICMQISFKIHLTSKDVF